MTWWALCEKCVSLGFWLELCSFSGHRPRSEESNVETSAVCFCSSPSGPQGPYNNISTEGRGGITHPYRFKDGPLVTPPDFGPCYAYGTNHSGVGSQGHQVLWEPTVSPWKECSVFFHFLCEGTNSGGYLISLHISSVFSHINPQSPPFHSFHCFLLHISSLIFSSLSLPVLFQTHVQ